MILVTGATGNTASLLIPALLEKGEQVRALVHDESKVQPLKARGVEVVVGDMEAPKNLDTAMAGADKVYLLTDNGSTGARQARNVIEAAMKGGSPHIVRQAAHGTIKSRIIRQHEEIEGELEKSGLPVTLIKPTFFMQNIMMAAETVASQGMVYMPLKDGRLAMVDLRDVVDAVLEVLTSTGHDGKTYVLTGPAAISFYDVADSLSGALGKKITYVDVPPEAARGSIVGMGLPEWTADGFVELMVGFSKGFADATTSHVEQLTGRPARTFETFIRDFASVFGGPTYPLPAVVKGS